MSKAPPSKKPKLGASAAASDLPGFLAKLEEDRKTAAASVSDFKFNEKRVRILSKQKTMPDWATGVIYWIFRDQRVQDNWALLYAQKLALKRKVPLHVCFCLVPKFLDATVRQYDFMLKGLEEMARECGRLGIQFHMFLGEARSVLPAFVAEHRLGAVVADFSPLRLPSEWVDLLAVALPKDVPFFQVDAHNIVPCWVASDKAEYAARTIRNKINSKLPEFLTKFPPVVKHPHSSKLLAEAVDWDAALASLEVDRSVGPVTSIAPGSEAGLACLQEFCSKRLRLFASKRNDPTCNALSNLSPWCHFGQISVQRCILAVRELKAQFPESVDAFCEEAIVRRELADNFCHYNREYDRLEGAHAWARKTLDDHRKDKRQHVYSRDELARALTHDDLWNSAQLQLAREGKMHGFLRMYWAKKILEWTDTPERALADAIFLNDSMSIDGRDPSGYAACGRSVACTIRAGASARCSARSAT
ncbi:deoxyribodipyrimidine photo-lyase isoform X2 [Bacillus rossius redtenbacheri]|uniref:deoxyribodipyrimidine photo-lyase isoform X2 n=1 Tax=Bacillus rossius redtenbacheri TaxID=93214 RepID=UPI002FDCB13C